MPEVLPSSASGTASLISTSLCHSCGESGAALHRDRQGSGTCRGLFRLLQRTGREICLRAGAQGRPCVRRRRQQLPGQIARNIAALCDRPRGSAGLTSDDPSRRVHPSWFRA